MKLSVIVLSKNAEEIIKDCMESVSFADEIILVDNFSIDETVAIAKTYGAKVINSNIGSFAEKRNIGLKHVKGEWVLYIDTDERVTSSLREEIIQYTNNPIIK